MSKITYTINCYDKGCVNKVESEGFGEEAIVCNSCKLDFMSKQSSNHWQVILREEYDAFVEEYGNKKHRDDDFLCYCIEEFERKKHVDSSSRWVTCRECGVIIEIHKVASLRSRRL